MRYQIQKILNSYNTGFKLKIDDDEDTKFSLLLDDEGAKFSLELTLFNTSKRMSFVAGSFPASLMKAMINQLNDNKSYINELIIPELGSVTIMVDGQQINLDDDSKEIEGNAIKINIQKEHGKAIYFKEEKKGNSESRFSKTLTSNDVGQTGSHQAGITVPKSGTEFFPSLDNNIQNPEVKVHVKQSERRDLWEFRYIYYNGKIHNKNTRNEYRLTNISEFINENNLNAGDSIHFIKSNPQENSDIEVFIQRELDRWLIDSINFMKSIIPNKRTGEVEGEKSIRKCTDYKRSRKNRDEAIKIQGTNCKICGFDFDKTYGELGKGFIEVHHIEPVSVMENPRPLDPSKDLIPICSNCHKMIHRDGLRLPDQLKNIVKKNINKNEFAKINEIILE